jgi:hypothetical protein
MAVTTDEFDAARFAEAFDEFLARFREALPERPTTLRRLATEHLAADPTGLPTLTETFDASEHANLQIALDALLEATEGWQLVGLPGELTHFHGFSLASILGGRFQGPSEPCAPEFVNVAIDVDKTLACIRIGMYLLTFAASPIVVMVSFGERHGPNAGLHMEVVAPDADLARAFVARVRELMHERNVFRGKILSFAFSEWGAFGVTFHTLPPVGRADIVLPDADLDAIERHTVGVSRHAEALLEAGRHLKRGLLLFGPPGTGKTMSVMYLCTQMPGRTTLLLSGPGFGALGQATAIARSLQPSMVVLEDVDLVAMERTMPGAGTNPLLFQLLNEMDGLADDADVVFVLTTNRVELLEPALAARPGRIDQAVEIRLPDADCRRRLLEVYLRDIDHEIDDFGPLVERTDGVTAAFVKELVRRAALEAAASRSSASDGARLRLTDAHLHAALDDLLEHAAPVLRSSLGANPDIVGDAHDGTTSISTRQTGGWFAFSGPTSYVDDDR